MLREVPGAPNTDLTRVISAQEVEDAITTMNRGKAAGVDRVPNDFFKDFSLLLTLILAHEFNKCMGAVAFPAVFDVAVTATLRKTSDSEDGLDYRPIALLSSVYKIFTRILASRLQRTLSLLVGEEQNSFVLERQLEDSVLGM